MITLSPAIVPSVHAAVACPFDSVVAMRGLVEPLPAVTANATDAPATARPDASVTLTTSPPGIVAPTSRGAIEIRRRARDARAGRSPATSSRRRRPTQTEAAAINTSFRAICTINEFIGCDRGRDARALREDRRPDEQALLGRIERRRMRRNHRAAGLARADAKEATGNSLHVVREVLAGEVEEAERDDVVRTDARRTLPRVPTPPAPAGLTIGGVPRSMSDTRLHTEPRRDRLGHPPHFLVHQRAGRRLDGANRPREPGPDRE